MTQDQLKHVAENTELAALIGAQVLWLEDERARQEARVDESEEESFPASDPPAHHG